MPIKAENLKRYPKNWKSEIVPAIRARSGGKCQRCHNTYDQPHRQKNAAATRHGQKAIADLFDMG
jgi:hypothetical protein